MNLEPGHFTLKAEEIAGKYFLVQVKYGKMFHMKLRLERSISELLEYKHVKLMNLDKSV